MSNSDSNKQHQTLYTIKRALSFLPFSESTLRRLIQEGKVKIKRIGTGRGMLYIPESEIERITKLDQN